MIQFERALISNDGCEARDAHRALFAQQIVDATAGMSSLIASGVSAALSDGMERAPCFFKLT